MRAAHSPDSSEKPLPDEGLFGRLYRATGGSFRKAMLKQRSDQKLAAHSRKKLRIKKPTAFGPSVLN